MPRKFNSAWDFWGFCWKPQGFFGVLSFAPCHLKFGRGGGHQKFVLYALNLHISHINTPCSPPPPPPTKFCISIAINFSGGGCNIPRTKEKQRLFKQYFFLGGKQGVFWEMCIWRYLNSGRGNKTQSRQEFLALPAGMDFSGKVSAQAQFIPLNLIAQETKRARLGQKVSHFHLQKDTVIHHLFKCRIRSPFTGPTVQSY